MNPGIHAFVLHSKISVSDLRENALYLTEVLNVPVPKNCHVSTLSLDSIEKDPHDQFDLFLYDSLNDESSDDDREQFYDCARDTLLLRTIADECHLIEQLTRRCSSLDSLDNHEQTAPSRSKTFRMVCARSSNGCFRILVEHAAIFSVGYAPFRFVAIVCSTCSTCRLTLPLSS